MNDATSFSDIKNEVELLQSLGYEGDVFLIGCKCDLEPKIEEKEILEFSKKYEIKYFKTSAKDKIGMNDLFDHLPIQIEKNLNPKMIPKVELVPLTPSTKYCQIQ